MYYDYKDLKIWRKSMDLCNDVYKLTCLFPKDEYSLKDQIKRCAVSIPSNIAEWAQSWFQKKCTSFLSISLWSSAELETQIILATELGFLDKDQSDLVLVKITEVWKMLTWLKKSYSQNL